MSPITSTHFWLYTSSPYHVITPYACPVVPTQSCADAREQGSELHRWSLDFLLSPMTFVTSPHLE